MENMYTWILVLVVILVVFFVVIPIMKGKLSFWQLAAKKPDQVFIMIYENNDVWVVDNGSPDTWDSLNKDDYSGPFRLFVPSLNQTVKIYGKADKIEQEQEKIMTIFQKNN